MRPPGGAPTILLAGGGSVRSNFLRCAAVGATLSAALAGPARAQSPESPLLTLTIRGGWISGPSLWHIGNQPALSDAGPDTVALARLFRPGFVAGVGAALFRSPHIAYTAAMDFLGITTESRCTGPTVWAPSSRGDNRQACERVQGASVRTNAVALQGGLTWRPLATGRVQPYLQGIGGIAFLGGSFVETQSTVFDSTADSTRSQFPMRTLLGDPNHRSMTWIATLAGGLTFETSPGTQIRFEARDVITSIPVATGAGNAALDGTPAPIGSKVVHLLSFAIGLDVVLEQSRRPHRY